jgi:hypothetical protein
MKQADLKVRLYDQRMYVEAGLQTRPEMPEVRGAARTFTVRGKREGESTLGRSAPAE